MILNDKTTIDDRINIIKNSFIKDEPLINRLFFMAKNGAITRILREIEHFFMDHDIKTFNQ